MRATLALLVFVAILSPHAAAQTADKERLREQARVPWVHFQTKIHANWNPFQVQERKLTQAELVSEISENAKLIDTQPSDADSHIRISKLYSQAQNREKARAHRAKGLELYRKRVAACPMDVETLRKLGTELDDTTDYVEKDEVWRRILSMDHRNVEALQKLALLREARADALMGAVASLIAKQKRPGLVVEKTVKYETPPPAAGPSFEPKVNEPKPPTRSGEPQQAVNQHFDEMQNLALEAGNPPVDRSLYLGTAKNLIDEGRSYTDRAIEVAPQEARNYMLSFCIRSRLYYLRSFFREMSDTDSTALYTGLIGDMRKAALAEPSNPGPPQIALMMTFNYYSGKRKLNQLSTPDRWRGLTADEQAEITGWIDHLERITTSKDRASAATSAEVLADTYRMLGIKLERFWFLLFGAVVLDPEQDEAWDRMIEGSWEHQRCARVIGFCRDRLHHKDHLPTRFALACAHDRLNESDEAEEQLRLVLKQEPKNIVANLGLAMMLLKKSETDADLDAAAKQLDATHLILRDAPGTEYRSEMLLARGIYLGLKGDAKEARKQLEQALIWDDKNEEAKAALAALGK